MERVQPYDRATCTWKCCECGDELPECSMSIVLGDSGTSWMRFDEPDWVCDSCCRAAGDDLANWTEYCKDCWHVMEQDRRAQFHDVSVSCPLKEGPQ